MLSSNFELRAADGEIVLLPLSDTFFLPQLLKDMPELIDLILRGQMFSQAQNIDTFVISEVRDFLFTMDGATRCMDLSAFNIQRGRDHGIPDYNTLRQAMNLSPKTSFRDITGELDLNAPAPFAEALARAYNNDLTQIDPYVGMLAEPHLPGAAVGEMLAEGLIQQFVDLRDGDPLFSKCDPDLQRFRGQTNSNIVDLNRMTLASVIARNTNVQVDPNVNVFRLGMPPSDFGGDHIFGGCDGGDNTTRDGSGGNRDGRDGSDRDRDGRNRDGKRDDGQRDPRK